MDSEKPIEQKNEYNRMEFAGALGDLGTLIPFVLVYITILNFAPEGVLLAFGVANVVTGLLYKTPIPIQPMKAIGTIAFANAGSITSGMVFSSGLATGLFWLVMGLLGLSHYLAEIIKKPVAKGIVLGLGLVFVKQGLGMAWQGPLVAVLALLIYFALQGQRKIPVLPIILIFGVMVTLWIKPDTIGQILSIRPSWKLPDVKWQFNINEFIQGIVLLALPQIPLTFANGILAVNNENNDLFPDRKVTIKKVTMSTAVMNLVSPWLGGIPMCHGAGGLAAHVKFGARTGGATVILGVFLIILAVLFSDSVLTIFNLLPIAVLGIIMMIAGVQLVKSAWDMAYKQKEVAVLFLTAALAFWNAGYGLVVGLILSRLLLSENPIAANTQIKGSKPID